MDKKAYRTLMIAGTVGIIVNAIALASNLIVAIWLHKVPNYLFALCAAISMSYMAISTRDTKKKYANLVINREDEQK